MKNIISKTGSAILKVLFPLKDEKRPMKFRMLIINNESYWGSMARRNCIHEWADKGRMSIEEYPSCPPLKSNFKLQH